MKVSEITMNRRFPMRRGLPFLLVFLVASGMVLLPASAQAGRKDKVDNEVAAHRFFSFEDAPYYTSPDKRIGVKILMDTAKVGSTMAAMAHVTFLPGAHIKSHRHVYVTEVLYVLKGTLTLRIGKDIKVMGPDTTAYLPPRVFHEYLNNSTDVVQFLQYFSPPGPEGEYKTWERPDTKPAPKAEPVKPKESSHIVSPPLPTVPGSPVPKIGTPKMHEGPGSEHTLQLGTPPAKTPAKTPDELKFKSETTPKEAPK